MPRTPIVSGNFKSNGTVASVNAIAEGLNGGEWNGEKVDVILFPIALHAHPLRSVLKPSVQIGMQNCSATDCGAFTGEVAASQVADAGFPWVLNGHSERRAIYKETEEALGAKIGQIMKQEKLGLMHCIGEQLEDRQTGKTMEVCAAQLDTLIAAQPDWSRTVVAYEPVWAIGTGVVATPEQAQETHAQCRAYLAEKVSAEVAANMRILYGGSANGKNCVELITGADIDGFLVGGASLKPEFVDIIKAAEASNQ